MATTTNFGWTTPDDTDLVKDGAAAIRTLGSAIDTSLVDLKGGTTGQVLSKASNTDLDYSWTTPTDQTPLTTKGDLFGYSTADARIPVGTDGQVLTADSAETLGVKWATASASGMTQLATGTLSGSSVAITSISGSYNDLRLVIRNYKPSTDIDMSMRFNNDSTSNRHRRILIVGDGTGGIYNESFNATSIVITAYNDNTVAYGLIIVDVFDYANTSTWKMFGVESFQTNGAVTTNFNYECVRGFYNQTGAITEINLFPNSGTFTSGDYILYGVK